MGYGKTTALLLKFITDGMLLVRVTTCLCDHSLAEDEAYVDTNNCPLGGGTAGRKRICRENWAYRRSGYCEYPAMKFDRSKMAEFEEER